MRRLSVERYAVGIVGLLLMVALVSLVTLTPTPVDAGYTALTKELLAFLHSKGVPKWFGYNKLEFTANILMFVPLGFFAGLLLPLRKVWIAGLAGTTFSVFVEVLQFVLLPARFASVLDVLANTLGGWVGIGLAVLLRLLIASRDRRVIAQLLSPTIEQVPAELPKPADMVQPAKPAELPEPAELVKPADMVQPAKPAELHKPAEPAASPSAQVSEVSAGDHQTTLKSAAAQTERNI